MNDCRYWCFDQAIVQRTMGATDEREAQLGTIGAALLKLLPLLMMVFPGIICKALFPEELAKEGTDLAFPLLVSRILPPGLVGLVIAGMLSALMSTLASTFNSSSTLVAMDIWRKFFPDASDSQL
eukprot:COSAG01_NODE_46563_length_399_cov_0.690000_1_plen_124_part_01